MLHALVCCLCAEKWIMRAWAFNLVQIEWRRSHTPHTQTNRHFRNSFPDFSHRSCVVLFGLAVYASNRTNLLESCVVLVLFFCAASAVSLIHTDCGRDLQIEIVCNFRQLWRRFTCRRVLFQLLSVLIAERKGRWSSTSYNGSSKCASFSSVWQWQCYVVV